LTPSSAKQGVASPVRNPATKKTTAVADAVAHNFAHSIKRRREYLPARFLMSGCSCF
jgi:hypothetical protein